MQNINMTNKLSTVRGIDQRPCFLNSNVPAIPKTKKDRKGKTTKNNIIGLKKTHHHHPWYYSNYHYAE
ncbi:hypothetical protein [Bacillus inaquosorum]|uniref:hypothetical protein n=1 Tax=Bacillus inaquosorum TaxID=483913 RepID=UPI00227F2280|nr:hypothetical protein [Bacillus inaquosorum]MCY7973805.1 hypothetical protein [Bacillus inaquosorum]